MFFLIGKYEGRVKRKWLLKDTVHWLVKQQNPASNTEQPFGAGPIITYPFLHTEKPILLCRVCVFVCVCVCECVCMCVDVFLCALARSHPHAPLIYSLLLHSSLIFETHAWGEHMNY